MLLQVGLMNEALTQELRPGKVPIQINLSQNFLLRGEATDEASAES